MVNLNGLKEIVVLETAISEQFPDTNELHYRGKSVFSLVQEKRSFEEVAYFLLSGQMPSSSERSALNEWLSKYSSLDENLKQFLVSSSPNLPPTELMAMIFAFSEARYKSTGSWLDKSFFYICQFQAALAFLISKGEKIKAGDSSYTGYLLENAFTRPLSDQDIRLLDGARIIYLEHGMNAATYVCRIAASTRPSYSAALSAAMNTLSGVWHGGAIFEVSQYFSPSISRGQLKDLVYSKIKDRERVMGFGHRVYRGRPDPRYLPLKELLASSSHDGVEEILSRLEILESVMEGEKGIFPNLDLAGAPLFQILGFEPQHFVSVIASARIVGWLAHYHEQIQDPRIIRPLSNYKGKEGPLCPQ